MVSLIGNGKNGPSSTKDPLLLGNDLVWIVLTFWIPSVVRKCYWSQIGPVNVEIIDWFIMWWGKPHAVDATPRCMTERICWKCGQRGSLYSVPEHQTWWVFMLITCGHHSNSVRVWVPKLETSLWPFSLSCCEESKLLEKPSAKRGWEHQCLLKSPPPPPLRIKWLHQVSNFATCFVQINLCTLYVVSLNLNVKQEGWHTHLYNCYAQHNMTESI